MAPNRNSLFFSPSSVTFYTTFTYWTTSIDGDNTIITSREETKTDIIAATITDEILPTSIGIGIDATEGPEKAFWQLQNAQNNQDQETNLDLVDQETTTTVPELESGEVDTTTISGPSSSSVTPSLSSSDLIQSSLATSGSSSSLPAGSNGNPVAKSSTDNVASSVADFNELDDDFTLASSSIVNGENIRGGENSEELDSSSATVSPSASRSRITFTRPAQSSFTPAIRPNLFRTRIRPNNRPRNRDRASTTVALITRSDVTPTLIATPVSSGQLQTSSPSFESSSSRVRTLSSASLLSRGQPAPASSSINAQASAEPNIAASSTAGINPTRASSSAAVLSSSDIEPNVAGPRLTIGINENTEQEPENTPVILSGIRLRRPDPFKARLKERQRQRLQQLRQSSGAVSGGSRTPIFLGSRSENIRRSKNKLEVAKKPERPEEPQNVREAQQGSRISLPPAVASQRDRARQRINALFRRRTPSFLRPQPSALLGGSNQEQDPLQVEASQLSRRRKRQVSVPPSLSPRFLRLLYCNERFRLCHNYLPYFFAETDGRSSVN